MCLHWEELALFASLRSEWPRASCLPHESQQHIPPLRGSSPIARNQDTTNIRTPAINRTCGSVHGVRNV
jgi:hypothetical protein